MATKKATKQVLADAGRYSVARAGAVKAWKQLDRLMRSGAGAAEVAAQAQATARAVNLVWTEGSWLAESQAELQAPPARAGRKVMAGGRLAG